ncbi:MAG: hypothetical protein LBV04_10780 [Deferribacteraceae bacterium]|nr:hypothetical protein [Deferribacteraceae bacterium]
MISTYSAMPMMMSVMLVILIPIIIIVAVHLGIKGKKEILAILMGLVALLFLVGGVITI